MSLLHDLFDLVAPRRCAACDDPHPSAPPLCALCRDALLPAEDAPDGVFATFLHGGPIASAIHRAKYGDDPRVARALGALLSREGAWRPPRDALIVPIPLHPSRLRSRGFNQCVELARGMAGVPRPRLDLLRRVRETPTQTSLDREARGENLRGAFVVPLPERLRGRRVVLVDDVVTTGSTMREAMQALRSAGAGEVTGVVLAAAALRHPRDPGGALTRP